MIQFITFTICFQTGWYYYQFSSPLDYNKKNFDFSLEVNHP